MGWVIIINGDSEHRWFTVSTRVRSQNWMAAWWASMKQMTMLSAGWRWRRWRHGEVSLVRLRPVWMTNHPPSVLWHCWFGYQTCKNRRPYNLYCVGADVKPYSINQSIDTDCTEWQLFFFDTFRGSGHGCAEVLVHNINCNRYHKLFLTTSFMSLQRIVLL